MPKHASVAALKNGCTLCAHSHVMNDSLVDAFCTLYTEDFSVATVQVKTRLKLKILITFRENKLCIRIEMLFECKMQCKRCEY